MWNYNLDEMPKDDSEIVIFFEGEHLINGHFIVKVKYENGIFQNEDFNAVHYMKYAKCWTYAPKDPIAQVIDWFDHVYPEAASAHSASYWEGLEAIKKRIEFKLAQHSRKEMEKAVSDEKVAEYANLFKVCVTCARHKHGYGAVCLTCGRGLAND